MSSPHVEKSTNSKLTRAIKIQSEAIQSLKDENRILRQRLQVEHPKPATAVEVTTENGEHHLYAKVIASYRARKRDELVRVVELFAKGYPSSVHLDNAYYLVGLLEISQSQFAHAEKWFDRILKEHPMGNKSVSALFAKAISAKKQNNQIQARELLTQVQKLYPGSGEAQRAKLELKLLNQKELIQ